MGTPAPGAIADETRARSDHLIDLAQAAVPPPAVGAVEYLAMAS
jgi:hypothetical protein